MITYNGNEMMLQNDMGNTLILDSATGNIMGLSPGFIPIGIKEHGGIMYITSVDKEGNGEIGTIPSPIIRDFYKDKVIFEVNQSIPINGGDAIKISNKLYPADKFIANLQMSVAEEHLVGQKFKKDSGLSPSPTNDPSDIILGRDVVTYANGQPKKKTLYTPLLSYNSNINEIKICDLYKPVIPLFSSKGVYSLELYSRHDSSSDILAGSLSSPQLYQYGDGFIESNYWYTHTELPTSVFPKDLLTATLNQNLKQFPSNGKPGYLAVKLKTEEINKFDILPRAKEPFSTPITYKSYQSESKPQYYTYFPGFYYSTNSGIYIDRIEARVIDESTANEIPLNYPDGLDIPQFTIDTLGINSLIQGWKNSYLYPPKNLTEFFANKWESESFGHMYNLSISNSLPQVQSISDDNSFILTTLKNITDHSKTLMESSTEGENKTYGGLFCVPLGEKYNNWYRAEIDYYDLYDNKQGTFTKRFNPYLNDVFGTNLRVDGKIYGDELVIGTKTQITEQKVGLFRGDNITATYKIQIGLKKGSDFTSTTNVTTKEIDESPLGLYADCSLNPFTYLNDIPKEHIFNFLYDGEFDLSLTDALSLYFYSSILVPVKLTPILYQIDTSTFNKDGEPPVQVATRGGYSGSKSTLVRGDRYIKIDNMTINQQIFQFKNKQENPQPLVFAIEDLASGGLDNNRQFPYVSGSYVELYSIINLLLNKSECFVYNSPTNLLEFQKLNNILSSKWNDNITIPNKFEPQFNLTSSKENGTTKVQRVKYFCHGDLYLNYVSNYTQCSDSGVLTVLPTVFQPSYSIAPYFCLTGTNDEGKKTYVSRFKKDINTELTYLCNFETDSLGNILNYITDNSEKKKGSVVCSYNHSHPFMYNDTDLSETLTLQAGIYILNIARCPGETTLGDIGTYGPVINFTIVLNGITYKYSELTQESLQELGFSNDDTNRWVAQPTLTFSNKIVEHGHIYKPLVLIVKSKQSVNLNIEGPKYIDFDGIELKTKFIRQSIGLYKLKNIDKSKFLQDLKFLNSDLYTYNEYMKKLNDSFKNLNAVEYYNQMQKYGIFFKSSYVFIDGLVSDGPTPINRIKIRDKTYNTYPYIPSDPSILPVELDSNYNYIWNAYAMPNEIITTPDVDHEFVFSNGVPPGVPISTKADLNNLRKPV